MEIPKRILKMIGKEMEYNNNGKSRIGVITDVRWSFAQIVNLNDKTKRWYGVEFKMKPKDGRAFWTKALNSKVKVKPND